MSDSTTETPAQARLRQAREQLAAQQAQQRAGTPVTAEPDGARVLAPGETFHALRDGMSLPRSADLWNVEPSIVTRRGQTYVASAEMIAAARNRLGAPGWAGVVHDEAAQLSRWGAVYLRAGEAPADLESWEYGSPEWSAARAAAHDAAMAEPDVERRNAALRAVKDRFGNPAAEGQTVKYARDRAYDEQQERINGSGVRFSQHAAAREAGADR
jgi:hypothetical protein